MNHDILREFRDAIPFTPFVLRMTDGRTFRVPHRDFFSISPISRTVVVHLQTGGLSVLNTMLIAEIEPDKVQHPTSSPSADA